MLDISGSKYGKLTVIKRSHQNKEKRWAWLCVCECGNKTTAYKNQLDNGHKISCGCYHPRPTLKHGKRSHNLYSTWVDMVSRCKNPKNTEYKNYGGRGVTVCDRWLDINNFIEDVGSRPSKKHSIDRVDNSGPYAPWNFRWATKKEQGRNTRKTIFLTYEGERMALADWADKVGEQRRTLYMRYRRGWSDEEIIRGTRNK